MSTQRKRAQPRPIQLNLVYLSSSNSTNIISMPNYLSPIWHPTNSNSVYSSISFLNLLLPVQGDGGLKPTLSCKRWGPSWKVNQSIRGLQFSPAEDFSSVQLNIISFIRCHLLKSSGNEETRKTRKTRKQTECTEDSVSNSDQNSGEEKLPFNRKTPYS